MSPDSTIAEKMLPRQRHDQLNQDNQKSIVAPPVPVQISPPPPTTAERGIDKPDVPLNNIVGIGFLTAAAVAAAFVIDVVQKPKKLKTKNVL